MRYLTVKKRDYMKEELYQEHRAKGPEAEPQVIHIEVYIKYKDAEDKIRARRVQLVPEETTYEEFQTVVFKEDAKEGRDPSEDVGHAIFTLSGIVSDDLAKFPAKRK